MKAKLDKGYAPKKRGASGTPIEKKGGGMPACKQTEAGFPMKTQITRWQWYLRGINGKNAVFRPKRGWVSE